MLLALTQRRPLSVNNSDVCGRLLSFFSFSDKELKQGILKRKGHPDSDGLLGLMKATEYPFRAGAAKLFILITNSQRVSHSSLTDETVAEALKKISARLVLIGDFP